MKCNLCKDEVWCLHPTIFGWICFKCFQNKDYRKEFKKISVKSSKADSLSKQKADLNKLIL